MRGGQRRRAWRALIATAMTLVAGIATPATAGAETGGGAAEAAERGGTEPPRITVTEIEAPAGHRVSLDALSEISDRGHALLNAHPTGDEEQGRSLAVWHRGETEVLWQVSEVRVDMSAQGHVVGATRVPDCDPSGRNCEQPMLWVRGESRPLPFDGPFDRADLLVSDRGHVVASLRRYDPTAPSEETHELVAWRRHGEVVRAPINVQFAPSAVNDQGQVALQFRSPEQGIAFGCTAVWRIGGEVTPIGPCPGGYGAPLPVDINRSGDVVGLNGYLGSASSSFVWQNGRWTVLQGLYVDINDQGQAVGTSASLEGRAVMWHEGTTVDLGTLGGTSYGRAVNEHGQVVGSSTTADGESHAVLWQDGQLIDLGALAGTESSSWAVDINNRGQILGEVDGRPVVWTVQPG
jgi:probable HAF family extracellular repeat protein